MKWHWKLLKTVLIVDLYIFLLEYYISMISIFNYICTICFQNLEGLTLREIEERISSLKTRLRTPDIAIKQENMDA